MRAVAIAVVVALGALLAACVSLAGATGGNADPNDASAEAQSSPDAALDVTTTDVRTDDGCPSGRGSAMIRADSFCIDATEATTEHYQTFLAASPPPPAPPPPQPAFCAWNTSFVPRDLWPPGPGAERVPVSYVDWCDAFAFCAWAGKRLCGRVGGGSLLPAGQNDATKDQWYAACSKEGARTHPYSDTFSVGRCVLSGDQPQEVATNPQCEGGYGSIFDLTGNVAEWIDACDGATGAPDNCFHRGGAFSASDPAVVTCKTFGGVERQQSYSDLGIRCCAD